jgi:hypothetical protein
VPDPIHDAAQALLDALRCDRPSLMEAPLHTPQRRRFKALYAVAPFIRDEVAALTEALGTQTTDEVLWEGRSVPASTTCGDGSIVQPDCLDCPTGTRVRVVRATDQPSEDQPEPTPEDKLVDLMGELERSVKDAKASRKRRSADQPTEVAGDE